MSTKPGKRGRWLPVLLATTATSYLFWRNGERWLRNGLIYLSHSQLARQLVSQVPLSWRVASRFVAGEERADAVAAARSLNEQGMCATMDFLGESVTDPGLARAACEEIALLLQAIAENGVEANVSVKLSQLGLRLDEGLALENMRRLLARARDYGNKVRLDMEESSLVDKTLALYRTLRYEDGFDNVGVVVQAYLYRALADVEQLVAEGAWVRLCKGAYAEPPEVAFPHKADTNANYVRLMQRLLSEEARGNGVFAGIATHDEKMIQATIAYAREHSIPPEAFEFQMLFGIRRELQAQLAAQGYKVRIYIPYGTAWYPYFVRRLAERPANLWFFISNLFR